MTQSPGVPLWYELMTDDADAAEAFYGSVLGWTFSRASNDLAPDYRVAAAPDGAPVGGVMARKMGAGSPSSWFVYFAVEDPDAAAAAVAARGGAVHMPGTEIPGVGRFAFLADPQGILFYVMRGTGGEPSAAFMQADRALPGHAVWNELTTRDPEAAIAFYGEILGIRHKGAMPMGALGDYRFLHAGETSIGAAMGEMTNGRNAWQVYFLVPEIDAAAGRIAEAGGAVIEGPNPIPGGAFSLVAEDGKGARFGLVGPRSH